LSECSRIPGGSWGRARGWRILEQIRRRHATPTQQGWWVRVARHWLVRSWLRDRPEISQDAWVFFGLAKAGVKCGGKVSPTWRRDLTSSRKWYRRQRLPLGSAQLVERSCFPIYTSPSLTTHQPRGTSLLGLLSFTFCSSSTLARTAASSGTPPWCGGSGGVVLLFFSSSSSR
jgi:hypothetical protein